MFLQRSTISKAIMFSIVLATPFQLAGQFPPEVRGRIVAAETGAPLSGARIQVAGSTLNSVSAADGSFHIRGLVPGRRSLEATLIGFRTNTVELAVANGRVDNVLIELTLEPVQLQGIRVPGNRSAPLLPPDAVVLNREQIVKAAARDAGELLEQVSGIVVTRRGGPGSPATASVRGGNADQLLVLIDGVPVNSLMTGEADLSAISLEGVSRVVFLPGSQSARYGARALSGVVLIEASVPTEPEISGEIGAGSLGERTAALNLGDTWVLNRSEDDIGYTDQSRSTLSGRITAAWRRTDGDFDFFLPPVRGGMEARRTNAGSVARDFSGSLGWRYGDLHVRARLNAFSLDRGMPGSVVQPTPSSSQEQRRQTVSLLIEEVANSLHWTLGIDGQRQTATFTDPTPPNGPAFHDTVDVTALGIQGSAERNLGSVRLRGGADLRTFTVDATALTQGTPDRETTGGIWLTGDWPLSARDGLSVDLTAGVRADRHTFIDGTFMSPNVGLFMRFRDWGVTTSFSRSFSPPSLSDQFFQEGVLVRPNPSLEPERVRAEFEAGIGTPVLAAGPIVLDASVEAFIADIEGMILWFPDFRFIWQPDNFDVKRRGLTLHASATVSSIGLDLSGSVTRARVRYTGPVLDGQVIYRPAWSGTAEAVFRTGIVTARADLRHTGSRRTVAGSSLNPLTSFWTGDLSLSGIFPLSGWTVEPRITIDNVLNERASMLVDYPFPGRSMRMETRIRRSRKPG